MVRESKANHVTSQIDRIQRGTHDGRSGQIVVGIKATVDCGKPGRELGNVVDGTGNVCERRISLAIDGDFDGDRDGLIVGICEGLLVVGGTVPGIGLFVGAVVIGEADGLDDVGFFVGVVEGCDVVGAAEGCIVGLEVVGIFVGIDVGVDIVGTPVGCSVGNETVGDILGVVVGVDKVGDPLG